MEVGKPSWADKNVYRPWGKFADRHTTLSKAVKIAVPTTVAAVAGFLDRLVSFWTCHPESLAVTLPVPPLLAWGIQVGISNRIELAEKRAESAQLKGEMDQEIGKIKDEMAKKTSETEFLRQKAEEGEKSIERALFLESQLKEAQEMIGNLQAGKFEKVLERWRIKTLPVIHLGTKVEQRYLLSEEIGSGGQSTVRLAINLSQGNRPEVMKLARSEYSKNKEFRDRFVNEVHLLQEKFADDPNVVPVYGYGEQDGVLFYTMKHISGASLGEILQRYGGIQLPQAIDLMLEIAGVFGRIHRKGIIHRDIKPDNILISRQGKVVVIDFGIARDTQVVHKLTQTGSVFGTPVYMAYEQHMGGGVDMRTDIYALGATFFEMLTGTEPYPFEGKEEYGNYIVRVASKMKNRDIPDVTDRIPISIINPDLLDETNDLLRHVFNQLLVYDKEARYSSCEKFIEDLMNLKALVEKGMAQRKQRESID